MNIMDKIVYEMTLCVLGPSMHTDMILLICIVQHVFPVHNHTRTRQQQTITISQHWNTDKGSITSALNNLLLLYYSPIKDNAAYIFTITKVKHRSDINLPIDTPHLNLIGQLWCVHYGWHGKRTCDILQVHWTTISRAWLQWIWSFSKYLSGNITNNCAFLSYYKYMYISACDFVCK